MLADIEQSCPLSNCQAAFCVIAQAHSRSTFERASGNWMAWFEPMGLPKTCRPVAYATALSRTRAPKPQLIEAVEILSALSSAGRTSQPLSTFPNTELAGTYTSSKKDRKSTRLN